MRPAPRRPDDQLRHQITNLGDEPSPASSLSDPLGALTTLVVGSVQPAGTIIDRQSRRSDVAVAIGTFPGGRRTVGFESPPGPCPRGERRSPTRRPSPASSCPDPLGRPPPAGRRRPDRPPIVRHRGGGGAAEAGRPRPDRRALARRRHGRDRPVTVYRDDNAAAGRLASWRPGGSTATFVGDDRGYHPRRGEGGGRRPAAASATFDPTMLPNGIYLVTISSSRSDAADRPPRRAWSSTATSSSGATPRRIRTCPRHRRPADAGAPDV